MLEKNKLICGMIPAYRNHILDNEFVTYFYENANLLNNLVESDNAMAYRLQAMEGRVENSIKACLHMSSSHPNKEAALQGLMYEDREIVLEQIEKIESDLWMNFEWNKDMIFDPCDVSEEQFEYALGALTRDGCIQKSEISQFALQRNQLKDFVANRAMACAVTNLLLAQNMVELRAYLGIASKDKRFFAYQMEC